MLPTDPPDGTPLPVEGAPAPDALGPSIATSPGPAWRVRYVPALLSAIVPGVGQVVVRRYRRAAIFGLPMVAAAIFTFYVALTTTPAELAAELLDPTVIWLLLGLQAALLVWRILATADLVFQGRSFRLRRWEAVPVVLLGVLLIVPQAYAGYVTEVARETADSIFVTDPGTAGAWQPSAAPASPDPSDFLTASPTVAPTQMPSPSPSGPPRLNVLLIGVDSGVGRNTYLTDTLIVASLDPITQTVSMVSVARDTVNVPLPDGRIFKPKINSLLAFARLHKAEFPGSNGDGHDVLMGALGTLLDLQIDYYAQVNLQGFVDVVNELGGVDVNVAHAFCDPTYQQYGFPNGFAITAGRHHLDGDEALAYARVRKASGESDFTRAARQQEVLSGIRDAIVHGRFLNDPVGLLRALSGTIITNVPRTLLPGLADTMVQVGRGQTYRTVIGHPYVEPGFDYRGSIQIPDLAKIRALSAAIFPAPGTLPAKAYLVPPPSSGGGGSGVSNCLPAPTPTPKPTPKPSAKPSATPTLSASPTGP
ncbi:MAG TPA: LCP family protein [Candidatus Sulfotelmatobacter sp.]|nr:LCP family protein [Candidatus Sulfotelmatobacter sp.]